jgi:hypothetical protein
MSNITVFGFTGKSRGLIPMLFDAQGNGFGLGHPKVALLRLVVDPYLIGGLEHDFYFSIYWEYSSQLTNSYFSEG